LPALLQKTFFWVIVAEYVLAPPLTRGAGFFGILATSAQNRWKDSELLAVGVVLGVVPWKGLRVLVKASVTCLQRALAMRASSGLEYWPMKASMVLAIAEVILYLVWKAWSASAIFWVTTPVVQAVAWLRGPLLVFKEKPD
jgi:hypothetical protein